MDYVILAFATWRIASLLSTETGPLDLFERLRRRVGVRTDEHGQEYGANVAAEAMLCVWCNSVWVGAGLTLAYRLAPAVTLTLCLALALSAAAILLDRIINTTA